MHSIIKLNKTHLEELIDFQDKIFSSYENIQNNLLYKLTEDLEEDIIDYNYYGLFINSKLVGVISFYERELVFSEDIVLSNIHSLKIPEKFYYIASASVLKEYEGNKIMSKLFSFLLEEIKTRGLKYAATAVNTDNEKMRHIVLKNNFNHLFNIERNNNSRGKFSFLVKKI